MGSAAVMATRKTHTPEQVVRKLETADRSAAPNDMIAAIMLPRVCVDY